MSKFILIIISLFSLYAQAGSPASQALQGTINTKNNFIGILIFVVISVLLLIANIKK